MSTQPLNRWEKFMAKIAGQEVDIEPLNRTEQFYNEIAQKTGAALTPTITEPSDGDVIKYDATTGKWVNGEGGGSGGGSSPLVVTVAYDEQTDTEIMDKTWAEIFAALSAGQPASVVNAGEGYAFSYPLVCAYQDPNTSEYVVYYLGNEIPTSTDISNMYFAKFTTSSADGYPHTDSGD